MSDLDKIVALRKTHGNETNFVPDVRARGWNDALVAVAEALGYAEASAILAAALAADYDRTEARVARFNAERRAERASNPTQGEEGS